MVVVALVCMGWLGFLFSLASLRSRLSSNAATSSEVMAIAVGLRRSILLFGCFEGSKGAWEVEVKIEVSVK